MLLRSTVVPLRRGRTNAAIALIALLSLSASAEAGDPPLFGHWSGAYIGAQAGGAWSDLSNSNARTAWGGHAGYSLQLDKLVVGIEADATWGGSSSSTMFSPLIYWNNQTNWSGSVRARVGLAFDNLHLYATGGPAFINQTGTINSFGQALQSTTTSTPGLVFGGGLEYRILPGIAARIEALRYDYSLSSQAWAAAPLKSAPPVAWHDLSAQDTVVRAGISWRFN